MDKLKFTVLIEDVEFVFGNNAHVAELLVSLIKESKSIQKSTVRIKIAKPNSIVRSLVQNPSSYLFFLSPFGSNLNLLC